MIVEKKLLLPLFVRSDGQTNGDPSGRCLLPNPTIIVTASTLEGMSDEVFYAVGTYVLLMLYSA